MVFAVICLSDCWCCEPVGASSFEFSFLSFTQGDFTFCPELQTWCFNTWMDCCSKSFRNKRKGMVQFSGDILLVNKWWWANIIRVRWFKFSKNRISRLVAISLHNVRWLNILQILVNIAVIVWTVSNVFIFCLTSLRCANERPYRTCNYAFD